MNSKSFAQILFMSPVEYFANKLLNKCTEFS
jgi:hypothetical protein